MSFRSAATAAALLAVLAACKPSARGRCSTNTDCRAGAYCASGGICLGQPTTLPVVTIQLGSSTLLSAQLNQVKVHVDADPLLALHGLTVEVDSDHPVASGSIAAAIAGDDTVALGGFEANFVGAVTVHATLSYRVPGNDADSQVQATPAAATMDTAPPSVTVSVPVASDASPNGWVPRTSGNLEVRARVDDGNGSGPASATLSLDTCPGGGLGCSYAGSVFSHQKGTVVFSFQVPRTVQAQGSEAPIAVTVSALDAAGNQGKGAGTLQIDDAAPKIGSTALVTAGVTGEGGNTWFVGGSGAPPVEIAVPVTDLGSGVLSLALMLDTAGTSSFLPTGCNYAKASCDSR